ncbi:MAG: lysophospholipid acyltransferase family protein [Nitrospira sp.]
MQSSIDAASGTVERRSRVPFGRHFFGAILRFLIRLFLRVEVRGESRVPKQGAGIIFYNHIHWLDPVIICGQLHRYAVPLTKIEASRWPVVGWLLKGYHVIFITRGVVDRAALKATWEVLKGGHISVIAPEGTRSPDARLQTAKEGLAFVARQAPDCWLIPAAVTGTPSFHWHFPLVDRPTAVITYGRPFRFKWPRGEDAAIALPDGRAGRETLREMTDEAMIELAAILPEAMQGEYAKLLGTKTHWLEFIDP